jgi:hypothetical protein
MAMCPGPSRSTTATELPAPTWAFLSGDQVVIPAQSSAAAPAALADESQPFLAAAQPVVASLERALQRARSAKNDCWRVVAP